MAKNILTFSGLYTRLRDRVYPSPTDAQTAEAKAIVNDGYLRLLTEHPWRCITKATTLTIWPEVTGTVNGSASYSAPTGLSTITATEASFYASMVGRTFTFDTSETGYTIAGYTSTTVVTVTGNASGEAAGDTFTIVPDAYRLASDFAEMVADPIVSTDMSNPPRLDKRTDEDVLNRIYASDQITGPPKMYAIQPAAFSATVGQQWDMIVYPIPDQEYALIYRYRFEVDTMTADAEYPVGGSVLSLAILGAASAVWEERAGQTKGLQSELYYKQALPAAIKRDHATRAGILGQTPPDVIPATHEQIATYTTS